jgi:hypothetical protein
MDIEPEQHKHGMKANCKAILGLDSINFLFVDRLIPIVKGLSRVMAVTCLHFRAPTRAISSFGKCWGGN